MNSIYIVIVIYKISLFEAESYKTLIAPNRIDNFFVYDNSPEEGYTNEDLLPKGCVFVHDKANGGLSKAYNRGAEMARQLGYTHILLLDQDTKFDANAWNVYLQNLEFPGMIVPLMKTTTGAAFSPVCISGLFSCAAKGLVSGKYSLNAYAAVNSGCCIPVDLFYKAGGYVDNVKLDFADFQFQLRLRQVQPLFRVIETNAIQDFSNDCREISKVKTRYELYLESARHYEADGFTTKARHLCDVLKHTLSLTARMRSAYFLHKFITHYLINSKS